MMSELELDFGKILLEGSYISADQHDEAVKISAKRGIPLLDYLLSENIVSKDLLGQAVAENFSTSYADLNSHSPDRELVTSLPQTISQKYKAIVYKKNDEGLFVATSNPGNETLRDLLHENFPNQNIVIAYGFSDEIEAILNEFRGDIKDKISNLLETANTSTTEVVEALFNEAVTQEASDLHFDPRSDDVVIRFRIDGVLHDVAVLPLTTYSSIINRIKILANLRIDEHMTAQDGAIQFLGDGKVETDMRVSILPTLNGEKTVIRIFDAGSSHLSLYQLGYTKENEAKLIKAANKPFGMILVTGPTGSGKTTVLYTLLRKFNTSDVNVMTIEDPVEYRITGINQVQVSDQTGLTFAHGLRSLLRQDPDVLLVGEIRDQETADIAVNAALTGHLLYSTFHANDAATAFPRLIDMGVEPFLLSSTVDVVIGQRLVRKLCESCRYSYSLPREELRDTLPEPEKYFTDETVTLYAAKGCTACAGLQYKGRIAIVELIENNSELSNLLTKDATTEEIWHVARAHGSTTLFEDGIKKVQDGITTIEELLRVAEPPRF